MIDIILLKVKSLACSFSIVSAQSTQIFLKNEMKVIHKSLKGYPFHS